MADNKPKLLKVARATPKSVTDYECSECGHRWSQDYGRVWDLSGYEPGEGEEIDCPKCKVLLIMKMQDG